MLKAVLLVAGASVALAQQYTISTVAGGAPPSTPVTATSASIGRPNRVTVDSAGSIYFSSSNSVFKLNSAGVLSLVAGNSRPGFSGDGGPAVSAQLNAPQGLALDSAGNLYIADSLNNRVRVVNSSGIITTFAGSGAISQDSSPGTFNDGGPAVQGLLHLPMGVAVDKNGNVFIADTADNLIREVTTDGNITTVAGDGYPSWYGDTGLAAHAELRSPEDVAVDSSGNIYIADTGNGYIRKITTDGIIDKFAGNGTITYAGDGGAATSASLYAPYGIALDSAGNLYIVENGDSRIRMVDAKGNISTVAGTGTAGSAGSSGSATSAQLNSPTGVAVDSSNNIYIADALNLAVRKISGGSISTVAGNGTFSYSGDGGAATSAQLNTPLAVAVQDLRSGDFSGGGTATTLYIADSANNVVRKVSNGTITNFLGSLSQPQGLAVDASGNVYVADTQAARIRKVAPDGSATVIAGSGTVGYGGDGGAATSASFNVPVGLAVDAAGNIYIADAGNHRVRKISGGTVTTFAGNGSQGYSGDGQSAANAQLTTPQGVAVDSAGNVYIADTGNNAIRRVNTSGMITTVAGSGLPGYSGDGGLATRAQLGNPFAVAVDASGSLFITDLSGRVRKVLPDGTILTIAGAGPVGYAGDGGAATSANLNRPAGIAVSATGSVYVADSANNAVRRLDPVGAGVSIAAVVNGAANTTGPIAPGEVIVIWGSGLGPAQLAQYQLTNGVVPTKVADTTVTINGQAAPVLYTSLNQVGAIVPFGVSGASSAQVVVSYQGRPSAAATVPVAATAPGLFSLDATGTGQALAINVTGGALNGSSKPANAGEYVVLYATGAGQTNPPGSDGAPGSLPYALPNAKVTATVGGLPAIVGYAGNALNLVSGVIQVNVQIPAGLTAGAVPIQLQIGDNKSQTGTTIVVSVK